MSGIDLYCGINETIWNHHPVQPGPLSCISPVYGTKNSTKRENAVAIPLSTTVRLDSGAFCDGLGSRLSLEQARTRQLRHAEKYKYMSQVADLASYDLLIDEKWFEGTRYKIRWTESEAKFAVDETVKAAQFATVHRHGFAQVLSAQGVTAKQYLDCTRQVVDCLMAEDSLGLGGWCITGKMPAHMMPVFRETIWLIVPYAAGAGVKRLHIWGVVFAPALGELLWLCDQFGLSLSTDSAGPQLRPARGEWGYMGWRDSGYCQPPVDIRGLERARHVQLTRDWLSHLSETKFYREPVLPAAKQLVMWN
jgi:hypothetical protein